jgi:hypothetical protein
MPHSLFVVGCYPFAAQSAGLYARLECVSHSQAVPTPAISNISFLQGLAAPLEGGVNTGM